MSDHRVTTGQTPPDFTLTDTRGEAVTLSDFTDKNNVYLVFNRGFM